MIPHLQLPKVKVITTTAPDMVRTCGNFLDDAAAAGLAHANQAPLNLACGGLPEAPYW